MKKTLLLISISLLAINAQAVIRYVTPNGTTPAEDAVNATSWATACNDLQAVIHACEYQGGDTIFVAAGTYKPIRKPAVYALNTITPNHRDNAFVLRDNVYIFGSFSGTENSLEERQLPASGDYTSILSGDFNGNDGANFSGMTENAYHVLLTLHFDVSYLDGFTITGGCADSEESGDTFTVNASPISRRQGGGIYCNGGGTVFTNIKICDNMANTYGGGVYDKAGTTMTNVIIRGNKAQSGGGTCNYMSYPVLNNVVFDDNNAGAGGGMYNLGLPAGRKNPAYNPTLTNVIFIRNYASYGGGIYNNNCSPNITNTTISGNSAFFNGSGMYNFSTSDSYPSKPQIRNSIIYGNTSDNVYNADHLQETVIWSAPVYSYCLVEGEALTPNGIIHNGDPLFDSDFNLMEGSPCINAGSNSFFGSEQTPDLSAITSDLAGNTRIFDGTVDIGAYEYQQASIPTIIPTVPTPTVPTVDIKVHTQNNNIIVENLCGEEVSVYDISGRCLSQGKNTITVPQAGIYIVKAGTTVEKIVIR